MPDPTDCKTFPSDPPPTPPTAFLCIRPRSWSIDRRARRRPELRTLPCVVVATVGRQSVVVGASLAAIRGGARVGVSLAEARAVCPGLVPIDHDAAGDLRALVALGRWMTRFTPLVATGWRPEPGEPPAPPVLLLDVTGCARLFGSVDNIAQAVRAAMRRFGVPARVTTGATPGAAWALTMNAEVGMQKDESGIPFSTHPSDFCVHSLPVESLRLPADAVARLRRLGLDTLGHVLAMPRDALPSRFGRSLARRLDQLMGAQPEPLVPLEYEVPVEASMAFDGAVDALETLWLVLRELVGRVTLDLARRGRGARRVELTCAPDPSSRVPPVVRGVSLAKPTRDAGTIFRLLQTASDRLDCGEGFTRVRLRVTSHERVGDEQAELIDGDADAREGREAWARLVERLSVRLGPANVARPVAVESYIPERAWRPVSMTDPGPPPAESAAGVAPPPPPRPLSLLSMPTEVRVVVEPSDDREGRPAQFAQGGEVHRLVDVIGPERIAGEWWRGHDKTRDYYDVRDESGRRFWLFRVVAIAGRRLSIRWFLHGAFAAAAVLKPVKV